MTSIETLPPEKVSRARETAGPRAGAARWSNLLLVRIASSLFILPNIILAMDFRAPAALVLSAGCALALALVWRRRGGEAPLLFAAIDLRMLAACLAAAVALLLLAGEAHLFYTNWDWLIRDAVLSDLVRQGSPLFYRYEAEDYLLRAPLGMYLLPATVGHFAGLTAAHAALLAQNAILLALCLYFVAQLSKARNVAVFVLLVALFSGLDALPQLFQHGMGMPDHLEWWNALFQYSSHVTQLFWVPNHALPGWWLAVLLLLFVRGEMDFAILLAAFVATLLWSPLVAVGAAPFLAIFGLRLGRGLFAPRILAGALAGLCFTPVAIYLTVDAASVQHSWLIFADGFALTYALFIAVEIPHAGIVFAAWPKIEASDRVLIATAVALLLVIPFYLFGPSNDLAMRASIVPLFLLAFGFAKVAASTPRDGKPFSAIISAIVILSAATPLLEVKRAFVEPAFAIGDCDLLTSWKKIDGEVWPANYLARVAAVPPWLVGVNDARLTLEDRKCWPDHPRLNDSQK